MQLCRATLAALDAAAASAASSRRPLYNVALLKVAEKRQYNPRFEEDFVSGKDYDPDRCARGHRTGLRPPCLNGLLREGLRV